MSGLLKLVYCQLNVQNLHLRRLPPPLSLLIQQSQSNALNIHFGLLRLEGRFLLFTLLPDNTGGVKRARALVHSRAVGTKLQHQATLTISRPSDLTLNAVRSKLKLDTGSASPSLPSSPNPQLSTGNSAPSPYLQPSPLRSHFPTNYANSSTNDAPPPPPDKDDQTLPRMKSNNSLRTPQLAAPPFQLPIRQSSREGHDPTSPHNLHYSPPVDGRHTPRSRQVSTASASSANSPASVGLGLGGSMPASYGQPSTGPNMPQSSSGYTNFSTSPRLASSSAFERDQRNVASHNGSGSPIMGNTSEGNARLTPRSASPAGSTSSRTSAHKGRWPQDLPPLPLSASPSIPTSNRSLEASTLDSMFRPSDSVESLHDQVATTQQRSPRSSPQQVAKIAVAEAIARAAEAKWQAEQKRTSMDASNDANRGNVPAVRQNGFDIDHANIVEQHYVGTESARDGVASAEGEKQAQEKESLRLQAAAELARLEEEARQRARAQEKTEQERREAEQKQLEAEAAEERQRLEAQAEAERVRLAAEAEAERVRLAAEADALRERQEAEAEAERVREEAAAEVERQRKKAEAELERQRQEAEAAAEAERIRIEEAKLAEEKARLEAIETAKREKQEARERLRQDLRDRIASSPSDVALTGFLSVQGGSSIVSHIFFSTFPCLGVELLLNLRAALAPEVFPNDEPGFKVVQKRQRTSISNGSSHSVQRRKEH